VTSGEIGVGPSNAKNITDHLARAGALHLLADDWPLWRAAFSRRASATTCWPMRYAPRWHSGSGVAAEYSPARHCAEVQRPLQEERPLRDGRAGVTTSNGACAPGTVLTYDDRN